MSVTVRAPGKVNLYLAVGAPGEDGYHPLATVFQAVDLYEEIEARPSRGLELTFTGLGKGLDAGEGNLAIRAARALAAHAGVPAHADLAIHKNVPIAGGMAGGSADAAGTLVALNRLWGLDLPTSELCALGAQLGADVPFCLTGGTALGVGRGTELTPVPARGEFSWVLLTQSEGLSTPAVFREFDRTVRTPAEPEVDCGFMEALARGDEIFVAMNARNDLAAAATSLHQGLRNAIAECGEFHLPLLVSGSGPTLAVFAGPDISAEDLAADLRARGVAESCLVARGPVAGAHVI